MDDSTIKKMIEDLAAENEVGQSRLMAGTRARYLLLGADRQGLLALARMLLRAAIAPVTDGGQPRPNLCNDDKLIQSCENRGDFVIGSVERIEDWADLAQPLKPVTQVRDRLNLFACGGIAFALFFVFAMGIVAIWSMLFGKGF